MTVTTYPTEGKKKALKMCDLFARGAGGSMAEPGAKALKPGPAFFYGWTDHTVPLIRQSQADGRDWYYADNAYYFGRGRYFRVTKNAFMHDGTGNAGPDRFRQFGIRALPWRKETNAPIIVATQSETFYRARLGMTRDEWAKQIVTELYRWTDRLVIVCDKPAPHEMRPDQAHAPNLEALLKNAWALVTHSSSAAVAAVIAGVPVFCTAPCMANVMGDSDLSNIERPKYPEREQWLWNLAAQQWTWDEIANGTCWRDLNR